MCVGDYASRRPHTCVDPCTLCRRRSCLKSRRRQCACARYEEGRRETSGMRASLDMFSLQVVESNWRIPEHIYKCGQHDGRACGMAGFSHERATTLNEIPYAYKDVKLVVHAVRHAAPARQQLTVCARVYFVLRLLCPSHLLCASSRADAC